MRLGANQLRIGTFNERVVITALRRGRALSLTELASVTGLAIPTVAGILKQLTARGLVRAAGRQHVRHGRPRTLLELVPESRYSLGVHLDPTQVTVALLDLAGGTRSTRVEVGALTGEPGQVIARIARMCEGVVESAGVEPDRVIGAGLASPGPIDVSRGVLLDPPWLPGWQGYPVRGALAGELGLDVVFEKDTVAAVTGETWLRREDLDARTVMFLYIGMGIGFGFSVDGEAVRGTTGNAGEAGILLSAADGDPGGAVLSPTAPSQELVAGSAPDSAPVSGPLSWVDPARLVRRAVEAGVLKGAGADAGVVDGRSPGLGAIDQAFGRLCAAAARDDPGAREILDEAGRHVAWGVAALCSVLDVGAVVCGGPYWAQVRAVYEPWIVRAVSHPRAAGVLHPTPVLTSVMGAGAGAIGAAALVLDQRFVPRASALAARQ